MNGKFSSVTPMSEAQARGYKTGMSRKSAVIKTVALFLLAALLLAAVLPASVFASNPGKRVVRVGWYSYPASSEIRNGEYYGYTYDYLVEMAKYTNWEYEFVQAKFDECCKMLARGELDIVAGLQKDSDREKYYDYPEIPYGETYSMLFTKNDSSLKSYDYESFDGISVGILKGTLNDKYFEEFARENGFTYTLKEYDSSTELNEALDSGEVDSAILTYIFGIDNIRILAKFAPNSIYIVTTRGNDDVLFNLNWALSCIKTNNPYFMAELYQKFYLDEDVNQLTSSELALAKASESEPVLVGVVDNSAPISFWNEATGAYEGIAVDMLNAVSEKTGLRFKYVPVDLSRYDDATNPNENSPQLVLGITKAETLPDSRNWYLSENILTDSLAVVGLIGSDFSQKGIERTVAVMKGFDMSKLYAELFMPDFKIVEYESLYDCMDAVAEKNADAAIYMNCCIRYILSKPYYEKLEIIPTFSESMGICAAAFTEETGQYIDIIDKGLKKVSEDESHAIVLNYTFGNSYKLTLDDTLYKYRAPLLIIACLVLFVIALFAALYLIKRRSDKQVKEALAVAKQAGEAKGNFMSRMSHEIRTPLNAVIGYNTIARNEMTEAKTDTERRQSEMKVMDCLTKSDIASRHLLNIINDVLDIAAIESGKIKVVNERFDFRGLISSLTAIFYSQAKAKGVDFDVRFETQMDEWIVGDQMRINQILTNLLSNAVKFTPDGGKVTLFIRPQTDTDSVKLCFEVRDTGIGMSKEFTDRIWTPFEQADSSISRRFGGTGLGLSITKTLVDMLGGSIAFESNIGEGTAFFVQLTVARTEQPEERGIYDFSTINALIVDDDTSTCDYIRLLLTRSGVRSSAVYSGEEAIVAVKSAIDEGIPYTVCLVDWRMPKMDGLETVKEIRKIAGSELPIIVITAYDFTEIADRAAAAGVNKFISKPLFQSSLFNLLANISGITAPRSAEKLSLQNFNGARVLLAEDNIMNMEIACRILESAKLTVDKAWNGQEALDMFLSSPSGTYGAILMDVQMPVMDGYKATQSIRASQHPDAASIPIIAMTADAFAENVAESHAVGMNEHISKPIDLASLFRVLNKYIH